LKSSSLDQIIPTTSNAMEAGQKAHTTGRGERPSIAFAIKTVQACWNRRLARKKQQGRNHKLVIVNRDITCINAEELLLIMHSMTLFPITESRTFRRSPDHALTLAKRHLTTNHGHIIDVDEFKAFNDSLDITAISC
jgi:hypothetical protein